MKAINVMKQGIETIETAGSKAGIRMGLGVRRNQRGLSTVETIALTVVVVGAVVGVASVLNPKLNDLMGRAFDTIASNLGI
jgi:hypothetical protein